MKVFLFLFISLLSLSSFAANVPAQAAREFIIDTDAGPDDVIAILYFLKQPEIKIKAITIAADGSAHCKPAFATITGLLSLLHRSDIPVACGSEAPLQGGHAFPQALQQFCDTFVKDLLPKSNMKIPLRDASDLLAATLKSSKTPIDILALGPLTNLAVMLANHPGLKNKIHKIYLMGGAVTVPGNLKDVDPALDNQLAEWNIYFDPAAAQKVFTSGIPITLISLDVTNQVPIDQSFYERIKSLAKKPEAEVFLKLLNQQKKGIDNNTWFFWDPMAAVIAADDSVTTLKTYPLAIRLRPESQSGATVIDKKHGAPVQVCTTINVDKFKKTLLAAFS